MRIAFVHPRFPSAEGTGATHSATQIVDGLANAGHDVCVYCPRSSDSELYRSEIELRHLAGNSSHPHTNTQLNKEIVSRLDELREFDIVHSYLTPLIPSIAQVGKKSGVGTIITLNAYGGICAKNDLRYQDHAQCESKSTLKCLNCISRSGFDSEYGYLYETASQALSLRLINRGEPNLDHIDGFQSLSSHVKNTYIDFGYDREDITTIPNILDEKFDIPHQSDFSEPFRLLYVGYLKKSKGVDRLVEVLSRLRARCDKEIYLTIVGDGDHRASIKQECVERGLSENLDIKGYIPNDELPRIYANHDVFLYPGRWDEPFGRIFLESMAAGTPVVSTDVGSVRDIIGNAGIVTPQNIEALVNGVLSILDTQTLQQHSDAGRKRIERYRKSKIIPEFEKLYRSSLK